MVHPNHRVRFGAALILCLGIGAAVLCPGCGEDDKLGRIVVTPARYDFGEVLHGDHPRHTFEIRNNSDRDITITLAESTCVCFKVARKPSPRLEPGERTDIEIVLESDVTSPQRLRGKYIEIRTDHPQAGFVRVPLEGTIFSPLYTQPKKRVAFGMITERPEAREWKTIQIRAERGYEVSLDSSLETWPRGFRITKPTWFDVETEEREDGLDIRVRMKEDVPAPTGRFRESLTVRLALKGPRIDSTEVRTRRFALEGQFPTRPNTGR